jgi:hypothetical protein
MAISQDSIHQEALRILDELESIPFNDCYPLSKDFSELPGCPGIYAVKYRNSGIVYVGKSGHVRNRFKGGHKVLNWALLDRVPPEDIRIAVVLLSYPWTRLSLQLERVILQVRRPSHNDRIAQED